MFIPLHDAIALKYVRRAAMTFVVLAVTSIVHITIVSGLFGASERIDLGLGLIPAVLFGSAEIGPEIAHVPALLTPVTSLFVHGSLWHLAGNMLFLWVFGDNVEDAMGSVRFAGFYLLCGIGAGLTYALFNAGSQAPLIGASGAISGVAAAYVLMYPKARVVGLVFNILPVAVSAAMIIGLWVGYQLLAAIFAGDSHIGWWAHVGGIISGALLLTVFKRREVPWLGERTE